MVFFTERIKIEGPLWWRRVLSRNLKSVRRFEQEFKREEFDRKKSEEVLKKLLKDPKVNAFPIAYYLNTLVAVLGKEQIEGLIGMLGEVVTLRSVHTFSWGKILPFRGSEQNNDPRLKQVLAVNCSASERRVLMEVDESRWQTPSLFIVDKSGQPVAIAKSLTGDFLVLGLGPDWAWSDGGVIIAPGVWYRPFYMDRGSSFKRGRGVLSLPPFIYLYPLRPWSSKHMWSLYNTYPQSAVMNKSDLTTFGEANHLLAKKFESGIAVLL